MQRILSRYPLYIDGEERKVQPHDLRRTCARRLYEAGVDLVAIQQNMGYADLKTTLGTIGQLQLIQFAKLDPTQCQRIACRRASIGRTETANDFDR